MVSHIKEHCAQKKLHYYLNWVVRLTDICQNSKPRLINTDCIYRKFHKKAKEQIQGNEFAPFEKTISQKLRSSDIYTFIADIRNDYLQNHRPAT